MFKKLFGQPKQELKEYTNDNVVLSEDNLSHLKMKYPILKKVLLNNKESQEFLGLLFELQTEDFPVSH